MDGNKLDLLKSKVHLTQRLLEDKHEENQEITKELNHKRAQLHKAEQEFYDSKQKRAQLKTGKSHASIDIDYSSKKTNNLNKKLQRLNGVMKLNEDTIESLKQEYQNLKSVNE